MMKALLLIDLQNDFCTGGALAVAGGNEVIPIANALMERFDWVVATQDWHPADHGSFAANHLWRKPGNVIMLDGLAQILWTMHCVQESFGAEFVGTLRVDGLHAVFQKGTDKMVDSYSGFFDNGRRKATGLADWLREKGVQTVYLMGLATDYCVKYTALDAVALGFETHLIQGGCRAVNLQPDDEANALRTMREQGVHIHQEAWQDIRP